MGEQIRFLWNEILHLNKNPIKLKWFFRLCCIKPLRILNQQKSLAPIRIYLLVSGLHLVAPNKSAEKRPGAPLVYIHWQCCIALAVWPRTKGEMSLKTNSVKSILGIIDTLNLKAYCVNGKSQL